MDENYITGLHKGSSQKPTQGNNKQKFPNFCLKI